MVDLTLIMAAVYITAALILSVYVIPFKVVPRAWAKAVQTPGHPAQMALDAVLDSAIAKIKFPEMPDVKAMAARVEALATQFNAMVPLFNNLAGDNLVAAIKTAYSDVRKAEIARGDLPPGELTVSQQQELEDLRRDPDGKAQLVAAENALDMAVANRLLKPATAKALKKQVNAAFSSGQPISAILAPYEGLLNRLLGGGGYSGGGGSASSAGPI